MQVMKHSVHLLAHGLTVSCLVMEIYAQENQLPQPQTSFAQNAVGDVVEKLGDNLMMVHQDSKNHWWFATWGDGLYRYDGKRIVHFTTKHGLSHKRTDQIVEDSTGDMYFNTSSGINRFDGNNFVTLPVSPLSEWKLKPGDLWFKDGKNEGGVYRYDGKILHSLQLPKVKIGEDFISKHPGTPSPYGVYFVYRDRSKNVWFGTAALGVCRYDGKSLEWLTTDDVTEFHDGPANGVRSIIEDHEGHFWFNTRFQYAVHQPPLAPSNSTHSEGIFRRLPGIGSLDGKPDGEFEYMSIAQDHDNSLWIATYRNGVYCYNGKEIKHYPVFRDSKVVKLFTVYCDRKGTIWLGTHEDGAYRFDGTSFEQFHPNGR